MKMWRPHTLPVTAAGPPTSPRWATPPTDPTRCLSMAEHPPSTILFVDDDAGNRRLLGALFRDAGFRLLEAGTGHEALELARGHRPDLIVLDVNLPDLS